MARTTSLLIWGTLLARTGFAQAPYTLTDALHAAYANRGNVAAARAALAEAMNNRNVTGAYPATRLEFGTGTRPDVTGGEEFLVAQPIDFFGKSDANRALGNAAVDVARSALHQTQLDLEVQVITAYAEAASAQQLIATAQALATIADTVYNATQKRVQTGDLPPVELTRADLERERARQTLQVRQLSAKASQARLSAALGVSPPQIKGLSLEPTPIPVTTTDVALQNRPDIQQALAELRTAQAEERIGRLTAYPDFELQFRRTPFAEPERYGMRFQVIFPLWDHGVARERTRAGRNARVAAEKTLEDRRHLATGEIAAARLDFDAAKASSESLQRLRADAEALLAKEQRGFELGGATLLDVLDSARTLRQIEESAIDAQLKLLQAEAALLRATGQLLP